MLSKPTNAALTDRMFHLFYEKVKMAVIEMKKKRFCLGFRYKWDVKTWQENKLAHLVIGLKWNEIELFILYLDHVMCSFNMTPFWANDTIKWPLSDWMWLCLAEISCHLGHWLVDTTFKKCKTLYFIGLWGTGLSTSKCSLSEISFRWSWFRPVIKVQLPQRHE